MTATVLRRPPATLSPSLLFDMLSSGLQVGLRALLAPAFLTARWLMPRATVDCSELPQARPCLALAAKIAMDELFFATEVVLATVISSREYRRITSEVDAALKLYERRGWLDQPISFHRTPPPLLRPALTRASCGRLHFQHLRFESGYEPHAQEPGAERWLGYAPNRTAHAWVLEHRGRPRPWLVCIPGYRMGSPRVDFFGFAAARLHRRLGLNVAIPVLPFHGPRCVGLRSGDGLLSGDYLDTVHALAQSVWDLRRLLSWVRGRAPAVGLYGVSLGGYIAALLASLEGNVDCVITGIPAVDLGRMMRWHVPGILFDAAQRVGFVSEVAERLFRVVSPLALKPRVPWEGRYLYAGMADRLVPPAHVRDLWIHWERPRLAWYEGGHVSYLWAAEVRALLREALKTHGLIGCNGHGGAVLRHGSPPVAA